MKFDVLSRHCDIHRHYILEASAGTGKTFSIENLIVRLLIEKEPLALEQILVVTFTRAATRDLKRRIRANVERARAYLLEKSKEAPDYLQAIFELGEEAQALKKLDQALFAFDQLQVFTIHGFCSRMLSEYAFEANLGRRIGDERPSRERLTEAVTDFLRTGVTHERWSPAQVALLLKEHQNDIESLRGALLKGKRREIQPNFQESLLAFQTIMQSLKKYEGPKILDDFRILSSRYNKICSKGGAIKPELWKKAVRFASLFDKSEWQADDLDQLISDDFYLIQAWDPSNLNKKKKAEINPHYPELPELLIKAFSPLLHCSDPKELLNRLSHDTKIHLERFQNEEELFTFDGLLVKMRQAIDHPAFCSTIRARYRVAVIDEFQDTDPLQWEIFSHLFLETGSHLYLVGDPKQSIYAFREADIYTYLDAAKALGSEYTAVLDTNYRSHPALIDALNKLFSAFKEGFVLPRLQSSLPYRPVEAGKKEMQIPFTDTLGSVHFCLGEEKQLISYLASEIERLNELGVDYGAWAFLVCDRYQGARVAEFLKSRKIPVVKQRQEPLSQSPALAAFKELIEALLKPRDESAFKRALGGPLIGWTHEQLLEINESALVTFMKLGQLLQNEGLTRFFPAFLKSSFHDKNVAEHLLSREEGIELYDDLRQIVEWLLSRRPAESILKELKALEQEGDDDEALRRLQNRDLKGVQILTIHASKGLEFEIVCPLGLMQKKKDSDNPEETAEKMRQFYVALTRAKWRLYIPVGKEGMQHLDIHDLLQDKNFTLKEISGEPEFQPVRHASENPKLHLPVCIQPKENPASISSYSSLLHQGKEEYFPAMASSLKTKREKSVHTLPAGSRVGNILHKLLEAIPLRQMSSPAEILPLILPHLQGSEFAAWSPVLAEIIYNAFHTPLPLMNGPTPLVATDAMRHYRETEFLFPWEQSLDLAVPHLPGYLKGVIDLLFEHEGKYYLLDWKSNRLGDSVDAYTKERMEQAMQEGGYFLQAHVYIEALRRYLKLVDSRPFEECFGGILYVFLRGLEKGVYRLW